MKWLSGFTFSSEQTCSGKRNQLVICQQLIVEDSVLLQRVQNKAQLNEKKINKNNEGRRLKETITTLQHD